MICKNCKIDKLNHAFAKHRKECKECITKKSKCEHNKIKSRCKICDGSAYCEHDKLKFSCKECDGSSLCEHSKQKSKCRECGGSAFCEHDRIKYRCKECNGSQICEHDKEKRYCKECEGNGICEHDKIINNCKLCNPNLLCEHDIFKRGCSKCNPNLLCEHNIKKRICKDCDGSLICEHKQLKYTCKDCNGNGLCIHNTIRTHCKECKGSQICIHYKRKEYCITCTPDSKYFCKECRLFIVNKRTNYLCNYCNQDTLTREKTKELKVKTFLEENNYEFEYNIRCKYQCISYFPDFKIDCNTFYLIIECDEYAHRTYDKNDEKKREDNIRLALNKKCVFIRYNPDNKRSKKIKMKTKQKVLKSYIEYYLNKDVSNNVVEYLFY